MASTVGDAGVRRARSRFSWERVAAGTLDAYARLPDRVPVQAAGVAR